MGFMVISDHLEQNNFSYMKFITLCKLNLYTAKFLDALS